MRSSRNGGPASREALEAALLLIGDLRKWVVPEIELKDNNCMCRECAPIRRVAKQIAAALALKLPDASERGCAGCSRWR